MSLHHSKESQWRWKDPHQFAEKYCRSTNRAHSAFAPLPPTSPPPPPPRCHKLPNERVYTVLQPGLLFYRLSTLFLSLPGNTFRVKESRPIPTLYLSLLPFPPLGQEMNTSEVEMMNLHNYLPPPQYVPPQGLLARTHEGWWWGWNISRESFCKRSKKTLVEDDFGGWKLRGKPFVFSTSCFRVCVRTNCGEGVSLDCRRMLLIAHHTLPGAAFWLP